jgi:hypothetical protein
MNAIYRGAKKHRTRAERVAGAAGHKAWQIRLPLEHFRRRMPVRPLDLAADLKKPLPSEAVPADTDAIAHRVRWILDQVEVPFDRIDDDSACRLLRTVEHHLALKFLRQVGRIAVIDARIDVFCRGLSLIREWQKRRQRLRCRVDRSQAQDCQRGPQYRSAQ